MIEIAWGGDTGSALEHSPSILHKREASILLKPFFLNCEVLVIATEFISY